MWQENDLIPQKNRLMADKEKNKESLLKLIGVPVAIALLAGGTSPWWVSLFRDGNSESPDSKTSATKTNVL